MSDRNSLSDRTVAATSILYAVYQAYLENLSYSPTWTVSYRKRVPSPLRCAAAASDALYSHAA